MRSTVPMTYEVVLEGKGYSPLLGTPGGHQFHVSSFPGGGGGNCHLAVSTDKEDSLEWSSQAVHPQTEKNSTIPSELETVWSTSWLGEGYKSETQVKLEEPQQKLLVIIVVIVSSTFTDGTKTFVFLK